MTLQKGFTLIELLMVIAIIAVLAVAVILTLNPVELLRQSRDSTRISDLATLKNAIGLYMTDASVPSLGTMNECRVSVSSTVFWMPDTEGNWNATTTCEAWFATTGTVASSSAPQSISGSGWIPVNFTSFSGGSPISIEPLDPLNVRGSGALKSSGGFFYSYIAGARDTFKLGAMMESQKYSTGGASDIGSVDGGINNFVFENGTNLNL